MGSVAKVAANGLSHMPYNHRNRFRAQRLRRSQYVIDECQPGDAVKDLGQPGFHPRALPRRENDDVQRILIGHLPDCLLRWIAAYTSRRDIPRRLAVAAAA